MYRKNSQEIERHDLTWRLLPLQFILMVLPLIAKAYNGYSGYGAFPWCSDEDYFVDVFLYAKMIVFEILAVVMLGVVIYKLVKMGAGKRKEILRRFLPLFLYGSFVIVSTICSENVMASLTGAMDAWEPVGVLLGYVVTALYAYLVVETADDVQQLLDAAVLGAAFMSVIGVSQAMGKDILLAEPLQRMLVGSQNYDSGVRLQLVFKERMAYGTLYNPNYVGTYVAMYLPLLVIGIILFRKVWKKIAAGVVTLGLLIMLFASQSRTGILSVVVVGLTALALLGRIILKHRYLLLSGVILAIIVFFAVDMQRDFLLTGRILGMFSLKQGGKPVLGVDTTGDGVRVVEKDTEYTVRMPVFDSEFDYIACEKGESREISYNADKSYAYFTLENGTKVKIQTAVHENRYAFGLNINGQVMHFTNQFVKGNYKYINTFGKLDECTIPANLFPGYEAVGSGRGYVWGRTIPLLSNYLVTGSGPDTYALVFPQNDYVARAKSGFKNKIFTRPHSIYLQMAVQTGVISLAAVLVFYLMYLFESCKRYCFRSFAKKEEWMGMALCLGTIGFMVAGLANDSLVVVTPMFYVMLGTGIAVNQVLCPPEKKNREEKGAE